MQQHVYTIARICAGLGISHVVVCPGSRSAPLVYAFTGNKMFKTYSVIDERSAAYMALGMSQQLGKPVVLICTSGTAALNFYPAIAESFYQKVPLLVLTADRSPEMLNQQDGQMIMQKGVYGKHVHASYEIPCYREGNEDLRETSGIVRSAIELAENKQGPVHINIPLSEPLYEGRSAKQKANKTEALSASNGPVFRSIPGRAFSRKGIEKLISAWKNSSRKLILIGQLPVNNFIFTPLFELSKRQDVVLLCDVLSNKQSVCTASNFDFLIAHTDKKTLRKLEPDLIISLGGPVLSKPLNRWLKSLKPIHHFRIQPEVSPVNTYQNMTDCLRGDIAATLNELVTGINKNIEKYQVKKTESAEAARYKKEWKALNIQAGKAVQAFMNSGAFSELHATKTILERLPFACNFQVGNSSLVRYVSLSGHPDHSWVMNGNRGTSGIDGCTSTALGAALINNRPTVLLTGDISFLYDKNALWINEIPPNLRIIVINNQGGGIFTLIDGPSRNKQVLKYFTTPHHGSIRLAALDNGLEYYFCDSQQGLKTELRRLFKPVNRAAVLEVKVDMEKNRQVFEMFKKIRI